MKSSRQVAGQTGHLARAWRLSRKQSTVYPSLTTISRTSTTKGPAGYTCRYRAIATSQTGFNSQEQSDQSGHTGPSEEAKRRAKNLQIATGSVCAFFGASYILYRQLNVKAAEASATAEVLLCMHAHTHIYIWLYSLVHRLPSS